jgi:nitrite reductase/ring-hydroxylating ferredoxin subunit
MKCPHCGSTNLPVRTVEGVKVAECCGQQFDPKTGENLNTKTGLKGATSGKANPSNIAH